MRQAYWVTEQHLGRVFTVYAKTRNRALDLYNNSVFRRTTSSTVRMFAGLDYLPRSIDNRPMAPAASAGNWTNGGVLTLGVNTTMPLNITKAELGPNTNLKFDPDKKAPDFVTLTIEGTITLTRKEKNQPKTMYYASAAASAKAGQPNSQGKETASTTTQTPGLPDDSGLESGFKVKIGSTEGFISFKTMFNRLKAATVTVDVAAEKAASRLQGAMDLVRAQLREGLLSESTATGYLRTLGLSDDQITEWLTEPESEAASA